MSSKQQLRQQICSQRAALTSTEQKKAADLLAQKLFTLSIFINSQHIALYSANKGEINPDFLLQQNNKNYYLPVLDPAQKRHLLFAECKPPLILNRYNILEPELKNAKLIAAEILDLVLVPLVAFDLSGNRLGMGAGFYDSTFNFLLAKNRPTKPYLLGLAYEWQKVEKLSTEDWDVTLDAIITDQTFYDFHK